MTKKRITILIMLGVIIVIAAAVFVMGNTKTKWENSVELYGPLNIIGDGVYENYGKHTFSVDKGTDFKITGQLYISEGSVTLTYSIDNTVLSETTYEPGAYEIESEIYSGYSGEICIVYYATDDVNGTYDLFINTRKSKLKKFIEKFE